MAASPSRRRSGRRAAITSHCGHRLRCYRRELSESSRSTTRTERGRHVDGERSWEIWDTVSRNLLMDFDTEDEALDWVWQVITAEGIGVTLVLSLGPNPGSRAEVLRGRALAERAFNQAMSRAERAAAAV